MPSRSSAHLNHYLCLRHLAGSVQQSAGVRCAACRATAAGRRGDPRAQGWRRRRHRRAQGAPGGSAIGCIGACPTSCTPSQRLHGMSLDTGAQQVAVCKACGIILHLSVLTAIVCRCWRGHRVATLYVTTTTSAASSWHVCNLQSSCRWVSGHFDAHLYLAAQPTKCICG